MVSPSERKVDDVVFVVGGTLPLQLVRKKRKMISGSNSICFGNIEGF